MCGNVQVHDQNMCSISKSLKDGRILVLDCGGVGRGEAVVLLYFSEYPTPSPNDDWDNILGR